MNKEIGLVLAGGGAKGAFEIGAYKALEEVGLTKNIVGMSGTSVGALNAVLIAQGDIKTAENVWKSIDKDFIKINTEEIMPFGLGNLGKKIGKIGKIGTSATIWTESALHSVVSTISSFFGPVVAETFVNILRNGVISSESLGKIIDNNLKYDAVMKYPGKLYATATKFVGLKAEHFELKKAKNFQELKSMILASAALPGVFKPEEVNNINYLDGGIKMNVPVVPLKNAGIRDIIVIQCTDGKTLDHKDKEGVNILLEIVPREDMGNLFTGTIDFDKRKIMRNFELGYKDALIQMLENKDKLDIKPRVVEKALQKAQENEIKRELSKAEGERSREIEIYGGTLDALERFLASTPDKKKKILILLGGLVPLALLLPRVVHPMGGVASLAMAGTGSGMTKLVAILGGAQEALILANLYRKLGKGKFKLLKNYELIERGGRKMLVKKG